MRYCIRCARDIGEGKETCPFCGTPQKRSEIPPIATKGNSWIKIAIGGGILFTFLVIAISVIITIALLDTPKDDGEKPIFNDDRSIVTTASFLLNEFQNNEIRAGEMYNDKIVAFSGCVEAVDNSFKELGFLTASISGCGALKLDAITAVFPEYRKDQLIQLNKGQKVNIKCRIVDGGDIMGVHGTDCEVIR